MTRFWVRFDTGEFLRAIASITATALGGVLLIADGDGDCENFDAFQGSADYSSHCPQLASGQGTLSLAWPAGKDPENIIKLQVEESGLHNLSRALIQFSGSCSSGEGEGAINGVRWIFQQDGLRYYCETLDLPVTQAQTVTCEIRTATATATDAQPGGVAPSCTLEFRPHAN